ncbi:MAG: hypothetical protein MPJ22_11195, partial [Pirellulales bacterium]|nr:hypothetical protein [Pirellulales bacterium]
MSRSGMTAIKANTNKYFSLSHNFFYGLCAWTLACGVLFSGLKAEETPGNQLGLIPNGDTAQGNINADEAASLTSQGEHPL